MCNEAFVDVNGLMKTRFGNRDRFGEEGRVNTKNSNQRQEVVVYFSGTFFSWVFFCLPQGPDVGAQHHVGTSSLMMGKKRLSCAPTASQRTPEN